MPTRKTQAAQASATKPPFDPKPIGRFIISDEILDRDVRSDNGFLGLMQDRLPLELVTCIYELIGAPSFQIAFALSCKTAARMARCIPLNPWRNLQDKRQLLLLLEKDCKSLKFCTACYVLQPRRKGQWKTSFPAKCPGCACTGVRPEYGYYEGYQSVWMREDYENLLDGYKGHYHPSVLHRIQRP
jgi:hypothetical protein